MNNQKRYAVALLLYSSSPIDAGHFVTNRIFCASSEIEAVGMAVLEARQNNYSIHQIASEEVQELTP